MSSHEFDPAGEFGAAVEEDQELHRARKFQVVLHNDDYTTMEFVTHVLMVFFRKTETDATAVMLSVHQTGRGIAGVYTRDVAETKVFEVTEYAKKNGMPLKLSTEPAPEE